MLPHLMDDIKQRPHADIYNAISRALHYFLMHTTSAVEVLTASNAYLSMAIDYDSFVVTFSSSILNAPTKLARIQVCVLLVK